MTADAATEARLDADLERSLRILGTDARADAQTAARSAWIRAALRIHGRYVEEWVEAKNLCPFAIRARQEDRVLKWALLQQDAALARSLAALDTLEATDPATVTMGFLIYPRFAGSLRDFQRFGDRLQQAYAERNGEDREMVGVVFHPDFPVDASTPGTVISFLRKSPDPFFQYTRRSALEAARRAIPAGALPTGGYLADPYSEVVENILRDNFATVTSDGGPERWVRLLAELRADRDAACGALPALA